MPEVTELPKADEDDGGDTTMLSPDSTGTDEKKDLAAISEGEDIADRAASMLQGLRKDSDADSASGSLRRRRESADDERRSRRRRRGAGSTIGGGGEERETPPPSRDHETIAEEQPGDGEGAAPSTTLLVSPPSPEGSMSKPVELSD